MSTEPLYEGVFGLAYILFETGLACNAVIYVGAFTANVHAWIFFTRNTAHKLFVFLNQRAEEPFLFVLHFCDLKGNIAPLFGKESLVSGSQNGLWWLSLAGQSGE